MNPHTAMVIPMMGYILALMLPIHMSIYKKDSRIYRKFPPNLTEVKD